MIRLALSELAASFGRCLLWIFVAFDLGAVAWAVDEVGRFFR